LQKFKQMQLQREAAEQRAEHAESELSRVRTQGRLQVRRPDLQGHPDMQASKSASNLAHSSSSSTIGRRARLGMHMDARATDV